MKTTATKVLSLVSWIAALLALGVVIVIFPEFKLAMGQMLVEGGRKKENLIRAGKMISRASRKKCRVIVLPECLDLGWMHPSAHESAREIPGETSDYLCQAAKRNNIMVVAGLTEREGNRIYNSALLINQSGKIVLKHQKINVLNIAQNIYGIGNTLSVVETKIGTIGVNICADNFENSHAIGHVLARMGAQFIFSPSAWAVEPNSKNTKNSYGREWGEWKESYSKMSRLYEITIVGVSNVGCISVGPWKGRKVIGGSLAIGPDGEILAKGPYGHNAEALVTLKLQARTRDIKGTDFPPYLKEKGYEGP